MTTISLDAVTKNFGEFQALQPISLTFHSRQFIVILGPSGCGKTTLLRILAGLEKPSTGSVRFNEADVTHAGPKERNIAMVFQDYALYPHMTVFQNIALNLQAAKVPKDEIERRVMRVAEILNLAPSLKKRPPQLSGGQQQRVALGRAIVREPSVFLMDEPLSNLDAALRVEMRAELKELHRRVGATTIYVTHDQSEAMTLADIVVVMNHGIVAQMGTPAEIYNHPANRFVAKFVGHPPMNFLPGRFVQGVFESKGISLPVSSRPITEEVILGIRAEDIQLANPQTAPIRGRAGFYEYLGNVGYLMVHVNDATLVAAVAPDQAPAEGGEVGVVLNAAHANFFTVQGERFDV